VDTRAGGGYVVGPGSVRPDGGYELTDDTEPAELPAWLVQALSERPPAAISAPADIASANPTGYAAAALRREADQVRQAPSGQHNAVLSRAAYRCGQLVGAELLDIDTAKAELSSAGGSLVGADCGCTHAEVARVIGAGLTAGARNPRRIKPRTDPRRDAA
jgi:hypothetical protein